MTTKIYFNTRRYEYSHGKAPRGTGFWAFSILDTVYFFQGSLTEGKAMAKTVARAKLAEQPVNVHRITIDVMP
jgi:hypothetical protein